MKKFLSLVLAAAVIAAFCVTIFTASAASASGGLPIVPVTDQYTVTWQGYTEPPALKFYVDETAADNTGNILDPVDGSRIFRNFANAIDYRNSNFEDQPLEIVLRSNVTNVVNFASRLTNVLINGNGQFGFMRVGAGNGLRAFETSYRIFNAEFRDTFFDGNGFEFDSGVVIDFNIAAVQPSHVNLKFTNVDININIKSNDGAVMSFFNIDNVILDNVDLSGSVYTTASGPIIKPVQLYSGCKNFDLSGIAGMPNTGGHPAAIASYNLTSLLAYPQYTDMGDVNTEPYNIYAPDYPYCVTYNSPEALYTHRTLAFQSPDEAKYCAAAIPLYYAENIECIIDLAKKAFIINQNATLENAVKFTELSGHGPDHTMTITNPEDKTVEAGQSGAGIFKIEDGRGEYIFDFTDAVYGLDYFLVSGNEDTVDPSTLSVGDNNNAISFTGKKAGTSKITLQTANKTDIVSFNVTVISALYTVSYDANGGTGAPADADYSEGDIVTVSGTPSRIGHIFSDWEYNGSIYTAGRGFVMPDSDVTLVAQWIQAQPETTEGRKPIPATSAPTTSPPVVITTTAAEDITTTTTTTTEETVEPTPEETIEETTTEETAEPATEETIEETTIKETTIEEITEPVIVSITEDTSEPFVEPVSVEETNPIETENTVEHNTTSFANTEPTPTNPILSDTVLDTAAATTSDGEIEFEIYEVIPDSAIPLENGWFAVELENDWWEIFDENSVPLGVFLLPESENIRKYDIKLIAQNIVSFVKIEPADIESADAQPTNAEPIDIDKINPQTGDGVIIWIIAIFVITSGLSAVILFKFDKRKIM